MQYISTRGDKRPVSSAEAIIRGLAPDGGLYLPETLPAFSQSELTTLLPLSYAQRAAYVLSRFLTDYSLDELNGYTARAYAPERFRAEGTAPLTHLDGNVSVLELYHGPTSAFKDFALQMLPLLLRGALEKTGETRTVVILTATSGDTGKAALEGFADVEGTKIAVFYPQGGTSTIQRLQMTTQKGGNVLVLAVNGHFDDAQNGVKRIFSDTELAARLSGEGYLLSSANSINWGRLAPQIAYYVSAYLDLVQAGRITMGEAVNVVVPTGNFGNILACYIAKCCGLPVRHLICASNENHVLTDFLDTGVYDRNRPFHLTRSPSMDILISSNLERLLYLGLGRNSERVASFMRQLAETGRYTLSAEELAAVRKDFSAGWADDSRTLAVIRDTFLRSHYLIDTHTAVAFAVYEDYREKTGDLTPTLIASTASPFKFPVTVLKALGEETDSDEFAALSALGKCGGKTPPAPLSSLKTLPERFTEAIAPEAMEDRILQWLLASR